jgi:putative sigma-54 modulation protein
MGKELITMKTKLTARHFDLTPEIRAHAEEELEGLNKFFEHIISAELIMDVARHRRLAEIKVKVSRDTIAGNGESDDLNKAIALAVDKVKVQLVKHKERLKEKDVDEIIATESALTKPQANPDEVDV